MPWAGSCWEGTDHKDERTSGGDENIYILIVVVFVQLNILFSAHRTVYLKEVNFTIYKLYLNKLVFKKKSYNNSTKYELFFSILRLGKIEAQKG